MRNRTLLTALLLLALLVPAAQAQETTGSVNGTITDSSGASLPGVSVEISSQTLESSITATTDGAGKYRFPALLPGGYELTASLDGFASTQVPDIDVNLGDILTIDFPMQLAEVTDTIVVTSEAPVIEITQSATAASISGELIDKLPRGRDFASVVTQAAHAADEDALRGVSIDGASGSENRFIVDGMDTTDLQIGTSGKGVVTDMVQEVQVKSSGYMAEYGGSTGGVISVVTKTGSNQFRGDVGVYVTSRGAGGDRRPTLQRNAQTGDAEFVNFNKDDDVRTEPGFTLGGPLVGNKLWFFGSYIPSIRERTRGVDFDPDDGVDEFFFADRDDTTDNGTFNITGQPSNNLSFKVSANISDTEREGVLPGLQATSNTGFDNGRDTENRTYSGNLDWLAGQNVALNFRAGTFETKAKDSGVPDGLWVGFSFGSAAAPGTLFPQMPANLQQPLGFENIDNNVATKFDDFSRDSLTGDATFFISEAAGEHTIKIGGQQATIENSVLDGYQNTRILFYWGTTIADLSGNAVTGPFGVYRLLQIVTQGDAKADTTAFFVQDSWRPTSRLTLNFGIRAEEEEIPSFSSNPAIPDPAIDFDFGDKVAPRIGAAYDLFGDGKWKIYGSTGVFYDLTKLEMPRGLFGGDSWVDFWYPITTLDWTTINCTIPAGNNINSVPNCNDPLLFLNDRRRPANDPANPTIDPNLQPMESRELVAGVEHQLGQRMSVGLRYVHKEIERTIEDSGVVVPGVGEVFFISNPGEGIAENILGPDFPALPKAKRDYDGIELDFRLRPTRTWTIHASYLYSSLEGNYSGLASSDEVSTSSGNGRASPNVNRFFDALPTLFDANGNEVVGDLGTDRPHQFKAQLIWRLPSKTSIGANQFLGSGTPISTEMSISPGLPFFPFGRGDLGRTPTLTQTDLYVEHPFNFGDRWNLTLAVNVLNLFDEDTPVQVYNAALLQDLPLTAGDFFAAPFDPNQVAADNGTALDPRFGENTVFQAPRAIRFSVRLGF